MAQGWTCGDCGGVQWIERATGELSGMRTTRVESSDVLVLFLGVEALGPAAGAAAAAARRDRRKGMRRGFRSMES
jgi:hypothetical protein